MTGFRKVAELLSLMFAYRIGAEWADMEGLFREEPTENKSVRNQPVGLSTPITDTVACPFPVTQKFQSFSCGPSVAFPRGDGSGKPAWRE